MRVRPDLRYASSVSDAAEGADLVLHLSEWSDYRAIDPVALADIVARGEANVWPAALRGTGFYEKVQTDHVLRDLVCRRAISLMQAQHDLERNWNAAWLTYVVAGDHP